MQNLHSSSLAAILATALGASGQTPVPSSPAPVPKLTLDFGKPGVAVSPMLYGLMTEEINFSYDGGIYAEQIRNRIFKNDDEKPAHWSVMQDGGAAASIALDQTAPVNSALTVCLKLDVTEIGSGRSGVANEGYWGIPVKPATTYRASFFAKAQEAGQPLRVSIESNDGTNVFAQAEVPRISSAWQRYEVTLTTGKDVKPSVTNRFVISTTQKGAYWFNLVSLFPPTYNERPNGNRPDIMQLLADMKPKFLRFPGGNFLEGPRIEDRFPWKQTLGPLETRPGHAGSWNYRASDGMGLLEFLEWCEDLQMEPLLAVYAGYSLRGDHVEPGAALQPFVDEALEEIEYVIGDVNTTWGAQRAQDGHPKPFPMTYVEIGNEDGFDKSGSYDGRYSQFYDAIKAKHPHLQLISTMGGRDSLGQRQKMTTGKLDYVDEHYYRNAGQMQGDANHYDSYDRRGPKVFVGEWATREGEPTTNMNAALGDAAWMTGMERNSDLVIMSCYAPLFVNVNPGGMQWKSDLIGYDAMSSYGSPAYYAQKMFNTYLGTQVVPILAENVPTRTWQPPTPKGKPRPPVQELPSLFFVATKEKETGAVYLKVVNTAGTPQEVQLELKGASHVAEEGTLVVLSSPNPKDTNSITDPEKIIPVTTKARGLSQSFTKTLAPYSINILQLEAK